MLDLSNKNALYRVYRIKKPNGKFRVIHAPCDELKAEQRKLMNRLNRMLTSDYCYGFKRGSNTSQAAAPHVGSRWVLTIDIQDFFPSITTDMLSWLTPYERELATLDGRLVQGSPCSPVISNLLLKDFDEEVVKHFNSLNVRYSRYADDLALSGNDRPDKRYIDFMRKALKPYGLRVNAKKVSWRFKDESQRILGIQVNNGLSINRHTRKQLRAAIHQGRLDSSGQGMLSYIRSVNTGQYRKLKQGNNDGKTVVSTVME